MMGNKSRMPRTKEVDGKKVFMVYEVEMIFKTPLLVDSALIDSSHKANELLRKLFNIDRISYKEFMYVLLLTRRNTCISYAQIGTGTTTELLVNVKEVLHLALISNACHVVIAHNHPSGSLNASEADLQITQKVKEGLKLWDCQLLDHLILTSDNYLSLADEGLL